MNWNQIGWKCKQQKKAIDFLILFSIALIILNIILYVVSTRVRYTTMADMAAEAATHTYWRDKHGYDSDRLSRDIARLEAENQALMEEIQALSAD